MRVISFSIAKPSRQKRPMIYARLSLIACFLAAPLPAFADDKPEPQLLGPEYCFPTEDIRESLAAFDGLKPEKRDIVGPDMAMTIELEDGEIMPERVELRDGDTVRPLLFDAYNRSIRLPSLVQSGSNEAKICVIDPAREGRFFESVGYNLNFGMGVRFKTTPGTHSLEQIEKGLKDGRSHYKKMAGAMGFMVPKFTHIAVAGRDKANPPVVFATLKGQDLGEPDFELYDGARMIDIDTLEEMGADGVRIAGDYYRMSPSPDAKTVAKFSGG